jgi:hypothetical protein
MANKPTKITKPVHDAGKTLSNPNSSNRDKELAAKVLSDRAKEKKGK